MTRTLALVSGIVLPVLFVLSWLGAMLYLRRMRRALRATPVQHDIAQHDIAHTDIAQHDIADTDIARAGGQLAGIDDWLRRAAQLPEGREPRPAGDEPRDQNRLEELARRHFPSLAVPHPHLHLIGLTGVEKRLLTWVCHHTGLPNPFDALERVTGDPDELRRATLAWQDAHTDVTAAVDRLCAATTRLHERWTGPAAQRFFPLLAGYLSELDDLATDVKATEDTLRALQAEAALAESTIVGLINLLVGSFGGYLVEAVLTVGTMTPAVAAQAQVELTWVLKQIAVVLSRLQSIYTNTRHVLDSVAGFKGLDQMRARFQLDVIEGIEQSIDTVA
jgi:uncharacterized protein YukE